MSFALAELRADHQPLDFGWLKKLTLPAVELIAEAQTDGSGAIHRDRFVPQAVVREELGARVGQILSVELYEPTVLTRTERRIVGSEGRQVVSDGFALQVEREPIRGRE